MAVINRGRQIQFINGINGVTPGGNAVINLDVNKRYHRHNIQCSSVNYTGATGAVITKITGAGISATGTLTIVNGVPTAIAIVAGGTGWNVGDTFTIADSTGVGFVGTAATVTGGPPGALATATVTVAGTPSATNPASVITALKQIVNGVVLRDISVDNLLRICAFNGMLTRLGELPLLYTEPWFKINQLDEILSWDMFGQSTFTLQTQIAANRTTPGLIGVSEYDYQRNVRPSGNGNVPFLQPVAQHEYTFNLVGGLNLINTIPFDYPIRRVFILGATPGNITQLEIDQDGNKVYEVTLAQQQQILSDYGFQAGQRTSLQINAADATVVASANPQAVLQNPFDFAYVSDIDQRVQKALTCENSFVLRITSAIAQAVTIVTEYLPGQYAS